MAKAFIRPSTMQDVVYLSKNLKADDAEEVKLLTNQPAFLSLYRGFKHGSFTVDLNGRAVIMFGIHGKEGECGFPWLLCSEEVNKVIPLFRYARAILQSYAKKHSYLANIVWSKNETHLRMIKWLGFELNGNVFEKNPDFLWFHLNKQSNGGQE